MLAIHRVLGAASLIVAVGCGGGDNAVTNPNANGTGKNMSAKVDGGAWVAATVTTFKSASGLIISGVSAGPGPLPWVLDDPGNRSPGHWRKWRHWVGPGHQHDGTGLGGERAAGEWKCDAHDAHGDSGSRHLHVHGPVVRYRWDAGDADGDVRQVRRDVLMRCCGSDSDWSDTTTRRLHMLKPSLMVALGAFVLASACGGSSGDKGVTNPKPKNGSMTAKIDGASWSAVSIATTGGVSGALIASGADLTNAIAIVIPVNTGTGVEQMSQTSVVSATLVGAGKTWSANPAQGGTGSITLTTVATGHVVGSFAFTLAGQSGATPATRQITVGQFDITY